MPVRTEYRQGTPCWAHLRTAEAVRAQAFYGGLFGWRFEGATALLGDKPVAAVDTGDGAPAWHTYLSVDDLDSALTEVRAAGGAVGAVPPGEESGRAAWLVDPAGAAVTLWQPGTHFGAGLVNEPGTMIWNELLTTGDVAVALAFYQRVLGVGVLTEQVLDMPYSMFEVDGQPVAAVHPARTVSTHWRVYFATAEIERSAAAVTELGGVVEHPPTPTPIGPMAGIRDPQGAVFSLWQRAEPA
ncbi:VOC family protein [Kutzneria viridogrisea]|uniref:VOC domain-containing protein n=1 Tax=Kutzneria viridogrisea TaxID=47990 RepID=A0ABR6BMD9_9PSEU|nr:hypothetical protein [Kutzneria viridogrisea]